MRTLPRPWQQASVSCATNFSTRHQSSHGPTLWTKFLHNFCVLILDHSFFPFCHLLRSTPFLRVSSCHVCFISKETNNSGSIAFSAASFRNLGTIDSDSLDAENWDLNSGSRDAARWMVPVLTLFTTFVKVCHSSCGFVLGVLLPSGR